jgi:hypothetical protein
MHAAKPVHAPSKASGLAHPQQRPSFGKKPGKYFVFLIIKRRFNALRGKFAVTPYP